MAMRVRRYPLDVLLVHDDPHSSEVVLGLHRLLHEHPAVRSYGIASTRKAPTYLREGKVNTLFVSPGLSYSVEALKELKQFISVAESEYPRVVVVIFADGASRLIDAAPELASYFKLNVSAVLNEGGTSCGELDEVLSKCEDWQRTRFDYDIALSFAGEDRPQAENIATALRANEVRVFYDQFEQASLVGKDLYVHLYEVYAKRSRYCVLLASENYVRRMWTIHERRAAQERALIERGAEYILPVRLDNTDIPGIASTLGYLSYQIGHERIAELLVQKLYGTEPPSQKRYIGYSLYDYDTRPIYDKVWRTNPHMYVPTSLLYRLIRDKEETDRSAISATRSEVVRALKGRFQEFADKLNAIPCSALDEVLPGTPAEEIRAIEARLHLPLPESYMDFLRSTRGLQLLDGRVQFSRNHPLVHEFPAYDDLPEEGKEEVKLNGGLWPPPSAGMICVAEYYPPGGGYSVLFDVNRGMVGEEYPVVYYDYNSTPPTVRTVADSFVDWLNKHCIDNLEYTNEKCAFPAGP